VTKLTIVIVCFAAAIVLAIFVGPAQLTPDVLQIRLSRVLLGIFAGGTMALCGCVLQGLFGNPLVEPYTLGSASGAALGASIGLLIFGTLSPVFAFIGALGIGFFVFIVARIESGVLRDRLILAGVVMSFLCSSLVMVIMVMGGRELYEVFYLIMGYLGIVITEHNRLMIGIVIGCALVGSLVLYRYYRELDVISQGTETAAGLGIDIERFSLVIFIITSLVVGLTVSLVGAIGFVGLVIPHIARLLFGPRHVRNLPASFVMGATFLLVADTVARTITVYELPVGVVTSIVGVPFFIYLYRR
jgi:iron complex transport system permease protein